ncbi:HNH endonuclease family protein [Bifidobacterium sp. SO1]|uniref:HNH endonuclease family protein n=1 Tax=Bifidobacterium sp. SO1 TaxID=2809029 RepID=UPI001BDCA1AF|nr:HNH endonuclease family protein [Bifidobacterium sp. SO1]MBT1161726.1 HNH endonuclease [Bifidobacterium sp. SO1]
MPRIGLKSSAIASIIAAGLLAAPFIQTARADTPMREDAATVLKTLTVTTEQTDAAGYSQSSFDYPKKRPDLGSKADQWDAIYRRDFDPKTIKIGSDGDVQYGELKNDPYSGQTITYHKGDKSSVDIEHVVARSEAWDSGASAWSQEKRDEFANDPLELIAVNSSMNRSHGEKDAARWLPSTGNGLFPKGNPSYDCLYVARQIAVKAKYRLTVDKAEHDAMAKTLDSCPGQTLPTESDGAWWTSTTGTDDGLASVKATLNGKPVKGFDPTKSGGWIVDGDPHQVRVNIPTGWTPNVVIEPFTMGVEYPPYQQITLTKGDKSVTWSFARRNTSTGLKDVTVTENDQPISGLSESRYLYHVEDPDTLLMSNLPDKWTVDYKRTEGKVNYRIMDGNKNLVAGWTFTSKPVHTITVNGFDQPMTLYAEDGETAHMIPSAPTLKDHEFAGWQSDGKPFDPLQPIHSDLTITATWKPTASNGKTDEEKTDKPTPTPTDDKNQAEPADDNAPVRLVRKPTDQPTGIASTGSSIAAVIVSLIMLVAAAIGVIAVRRNNGMHEDDPIA